MAGVPTSSEQHQLRLEHSGAQADDLPQERKNPEPRTTPAPRPKHRGPLESCKLLFAGAMSAVVARTCVAPLERVKMELVLRQGQGNALSTAAQVFRVEGLPGFWKGNALNVLRTAPFKAINFCAFDSFHTLLTGLTRQDDNTARFTAGALAGVTATLICFPLDVVRTRLLSRAHTSRYGSNPFVNLAGMLRDEGPGALYSGCLPAVLGMAPAGAVFYGVYDLLKHRHLAAAAAANAQQQQQEEGYQQQHGQAVLWHTPAATCTAEGTQHGLSCHHRAAGSPQGEPYCCSCQEGGSSQGQGQGWGSQARGGAPPTPALLTDTAAPLQLQPAYSLMYGAAAGACAELLVYPLEVVRRRIQMQSMAAASTLHGLHGRAMGAGLAAAKLAAVPPATTPASAAAAMALGETAAAVATAGVAAAVARLSALRVVSPAAMAAAVAAAAGAGVVGLAGRGRAGLEGCTRMWLVCHAILQAEGPQGLYRGLLPNLLQVLPSAALSYYTYDTLKEQLGVRG